MRYIFFLCIAVFMSACTKSEFTLQFNLDKKITENYDVVYYAADKNGGLTVQTVASVREGICDLTGKVNDVTLLYINRQRNKLPLVVMAKKGETIKIKGEDAHQLSWIVEGNEVNDTLSIWRIKNLKKLENNIPDSVNNAVKDFVVDHPDSEVSLLLMLCYYYRKVNEKEYTELMASLPVNKKTKKWMEIAARADQMYPAYSYPARLESLIMRSLDKEGDTLRINGRDPVLMLFWQIGYNDKKKLVDSLKNLNKEFPDSILLVADLCLDADSAGWRGSIRRDSLDYVKRFWVPTGFTDPTVEKFKVNSLPYFIVFEKNGRQSYRGNDLTEALKDYRKLMEVSDTLKNKKSRSVKK